MLFLVLGPLALPLLYKSPAFTTRAKIFWTLAVLLYTAIAVALIVVMVMYIWHMLQPLLNVQ
jgi:hypothetical protein